MTNMPVISDLAPWQDTSIPFYVRVIGYVAIFLLAGLILWSSLTLIAAVLMAAQASSDVSFIIRQIAPPLIGLIVGIYVWGKIRRYAFGHDDFRPRYSIVPTVLGEPMSIAMTKPIRGTGSLQFTNSGIRIQAKNAPAGGSASNDSITGFIVGLIWDLTINEITKRKVEFDFGYEQITEIKVARRNVSVLARAIPSKAIRFMVSSRDGERLYRELNAHYPSAVEEWKYLLL